MNRDKPHAFIIKSLSKKEKEPLHLSKFLAMFLMGLLISFHQGLAGLYQCPVMGDVLLEEDSLCKSSTV